MASIPRRSLLVAIAIVPIAFLAILGGTNVVALDDDGAPAAAEVWGGSDPFVTDTDGDGLDDATEYDIGTDPRVADTDGDGVEDGRERQLGTDPTRADTDDDGLPDGSEVAIGTDPFLADTDGDGLPDGAEVDGATRDGVSLPDADPLRMTLYVRIDHAEGAAPVSAADAERLAAHFAAMPIENPDGSTGVDLQVQRGDRLKVGPYTGENFDALAAASERVRGDRSRVARGILVVPFESDLASVGYGRTPGRFLVVDAGASADDRESIAVHELLHNVLGELDASPGRCEADPAHYCDGGWLEPSLGDGFERTLPQPVAEQVEDDGFQG
ncbi:hypothetical protein L593_08365 [Salinarchaeum sp. Harcht-Bsk1]|uniref:thrombospondin type 3 repeat-containing protein n=1 Tax=Salinarchaeum sp. Harcht-Bsk1 TaxID=1333523 RepID=UPI0003422A00|nr:thrombospondin type 3 repeat-containing protein [Salinarchaeum sp. Harcht-Bsk1]AGN01618.1 hypothetical protein L593_08365 [Salinarchaeum sp. Harcht-Bsk1]